MRCQDASKDAGSSSSVIKLHPKMQFTKIFLESLLMMILKDTSS